MISEAIHTPKENAAATSITTKVGDILENLPRYHQTRLPRGLGDERLQYLLEMIARSSQ